MERVLNEGQHVIYTDPVGVPHDAIVTRWWSGGIYNPATGESPRCQTLSEFKAGYGPESMPCLNLVIVTGDAKKTDEYGQQIERYTSICHRSTMPACHGNFYEFPDERA